jgi:hypothetical protein
MAGKLLSLSRTTKKYMRTIGTWKMMPLDNTAVLRKQVKWLITIIGIIINLF